MLITVGLKGLSEHDDLVLKCVVPGKKVIGEGGWVYLKLNWNFLRREGGCGRGVQPKHPQWEGSGYILEQQNPSFFKLTLL